MGSLILNNLFSIKDSKNKWNMVYKTQFKSKITVASSAKLACYEEKSYDDIDKLIEALRKDLLWLRIKRATRQEFKPSEIKAGKRKIARLMTARRNKEIKEYGGSKKTRRNKNPNKPSRLLLEYQIVRRK